ncbi:methyl-accepting chemotaxis protein [Methylomonas koyamae]|uniref:Chemotaxis protein n=1 Tax=Methylomonas koyamae TaxID=702114 RepID=A0A291IJ65_9GAMM|nr:methyl-accepting chemotaxis protein [Methylomonas koyamae]ATG90228.1 chemotaxis protein [Methylomonas koyamae]OAI25357.1 chemotaxis protein [Methylomonas koyamae]
MKLNHPVTDREVLMKPGTILVTRTNLKGVITYANDAFIEISGFSKDELIGSNHNVVRHPDMPSAAFADLWMCLKNGKPWTAPVKNRTKSGDYYWVEANVTPVFKNGKVQEYLSVRYAPSREQIAQAESLYEKLNANKASMRPKGLVAAIKKISEIGFWKKVAIIYLIFLLPTLSSIYDHYAEQKYLEMSLFLGLATFASVMGYMLINSVMNAFEKAIGICYRMADEQFRNSIDLDRGDEIGDFYRALYGMQVKLNSDLAFSKQVASEAMRIKQALDNVQSCVMVANNDLDIIYMNKTVSEMFQNAQQDIRKQLPKFDASNLLGANIDQFHKNPGHQRQLLANLNATFSSALVIGDRHMNIVANPVRNDENERIGVVVEWLDRTHEVKIEQEIAGIVEAVKAGELSSRIELADKRGFFEKLSEGINELTDVIENVFRDIGSTMQSMAAGDLTNRITSEYEGVYLNCKNDINATIDKLNEIFGQVSESAHFINNSSQEIASGNNNLSQRAEQQAANLEQTAASMEELTSTVKNNADNAQQANLVANNAKELAEKGGNVVKAAVSAMQEINESSNKIADIIGVIDEIAFQTNLLALNASVEAARAGEQGRGFSVVATEVRNLAQRSATAARESKELIQNSVQKVRAGTEFVNETGKALTEIVAGVKKVGDIVAQIADASVEQSAGIGQVNQAVAQMDEITQQNAALAEEASAASISMSDLSTNMVEMLAFFKTENNAGQHPVAQRRHATGAVRTEPARTVSAPASNSQPAFVARSNDTDDEWQDF